MRATATTWPPASTTAKASASPCRRASASPASIRRRARSRESTEPMLFAQGRAHDDAEQVTLWRRDDRLLQVLRVELLAQLVDGGVRADGGGTGRHDLLGGLPVLHG